MSSVSLIGNSGIQFIDRHFNIHDESPALKVRTELLLDRQPGQSGETEIRMVLPEYDEDTGGFIDPETQKPVNDAEMESYKFRQALECFEGTWLPVPFFRKAYFQNAATEEDFHEGPVAWSRMWFRAIPNSEEYNLVLSFDTKCFEPSEQGNSESYMTPEPKDCDHNTFALASQLADNIPLIQSDWCQDWLKQCVKERAHRRAGLRLGQNEEETAEEFEVRLTYVAITLYLTLLKGLEVTEAFPTVSLHDSENHIEVDLVLDIGNSRSCGLLMETARPQEPVSFANCSRLELRDLTLPDQRYDLPFEMHCEFLEANFGLESAARLSGYKGAFDWPGLLRVGPEAVRMAVLNGNSHHVTGMSSPKRYLWDDTEFRENPWHFNQLDANKQPKRVFNEFTTLFTERGQLCEEGIAPVIQAKYPRASLMTFALTEILSHALTQINSYKFRKHHGQEFVRRKLKRVVLTCPTAMLLTEKYRLRAAARDAIAALRQYMGENLIDTELQIVPNPDYIRPEQLEDDIDPSNTRIDWGYDEATCVQLAFLYGEIHERFLNDAELFFKTLGTDRQAIKNADKGQYYPEAPTVTIASLDIGGGTSDLMICSYQRDMQASSTVIIPIPEFWEGFNLAGDDILRAIIEKIVLPRIRKKLEDSIASDKAADLMNLLFGADHGGQSAQARIIRKQFANQIALPVALGMLNHVRKESTDEKKNFEEFFIQHPTPHAELIQYIDNECQKMGATEFSLRQLSWYLDTQEINSVIQHLIQPALSNLAGIVSQYKCDYFLLAGQPSTLPVLHDILLRFLPLSADRIIPLGNYRIGSWYPFANARGMVSDPKTCVAVGAAIGLMGGSLGRLLGFRIDTEKLRDHIRSTAKYIGFYKRKRATVKAQDIIFTAGVYEKEIIFHSPVLLGMRQLEAEQWRATPMYHLGYTSLKAAEDLARRAPFKMTLRRHERNGELIYRIEAVERQIDGQRVNPNQFSIKLQTLVEEQGHWLDTGSFLVSQF